MSSPHSRSCTTPPLDRSGGRRRYFAPALALVFFAIWFAGCSSTPTVGVRPSFEDTRVRDLGIVPFYATGNFSRSEEEMAKTIEIYEAVATRWLEESGFRVTSPEAFENALEKKESLSTFRTEISLTKGLEQHFEQAEDSETETSEAAALRRLHDAGKLPEEILLFGEIVYQSTGTCRTQPKRYTRHAKLVVEPSVADLGAAPCVVSHFQAKLIDASSGQTMWHNRFLREHRAKTITPALRKENIARAVVETLSGKHGMMRFRGPAGESSAE